MAYIMGQVLVASGAGVQPLFTVPAGLCNVTFWNTASTIYIGSSTTASTVNGLVCHSIPTSFFTYVGSRSATFYGTVSSGTAQVNYIITTNF